AKVLRERDDDSRLALRRLFGLLTPSQEESNAVKIDRRLICRVRLFINGENAHRVESWLSRYKTSLPHSRDRSLLENILRNFVASRSEVEATKCNLAESRTLRAEMWSKCTAIRSVLQNMPESMTPALRQNAN